MNDRNDVGQELSYSITAITGGGSVDTFLADATTIYKSHLNSVRGRVGVYWTSLLS